MTHAASRQNIYYWKCDRAASFHGTAQGEARVRPGLERAVHELVARQFGEEPTQVQAGGGQGNHLTFIAEIAERSYFVRIEDGPEQDDYMEVETCVMRKVRDLGVPGPEIIAADASRRLVPFAWQIMALVPESDLNRHFKAGTLDTEIVAEQLGRLIGLWQGVSVEQFGFFNPTLARAKNILRGTHFRYADYFFTRLDTHLDFLVEHALLSRQQGIEIHAEIERHSSLLILSQGCLVHKDLALWNVLGTERAITAVIDWDDCIAGDPMDDLSLLGCFHDGAFLRRAFVGYASVRPLPSDHVARFWLHLLRNMLFKAVIRVGAGYFEQTADFFLLGATGGGAALREHTLARMDAALDGLRNNVNPFAL